MAGECILNKDSDLYKIYIKVAELMDAELNQLPLSNNDKAQIFYEIVMNLILTFLLSISGEDDRVIAMTAMIRDLRESMHFINQSRPKTETLN